MLIVADTGLDTNPLPLIVLTPVRGPTLLMPLLPMSSRWFMEIVPPVVIGSVEGAVMPVTLLIGWLPISKKDVIKSPALGCIVMELVEIRPATLLMLLFVTLMPPVALN